jgi:uncharacterized protein YaaW (UPF0174 family)
MDEKRADEILSAHAEALLGRSEGLSQADVTDEEQDELTPLLTLAEQLNQSMPPVQPSAAFVHSLGKELASSAQRQVAASQRMRRGVLIGAATVGSLVSIASVVGAIIYVISRFRGRSHAHVQ